MNQELISFSIINCKIKWKEILDKIKREFFFLMKMETRQNVNCRNLFQFTLYFIQNLFQPYLQMQLALKSLFRMSSNIGFIGLGNMGLPMAINLAKKNHKVFAFDVDARRADDCKANNITFRDNIGALAKDANIFVTMLPNSQHSIDVCQTKEGGLFNNTSKDTLIIDCSTISPTVAMSLNAAGKTKGITYVDAPVSGGVTGAAAGTLTFMVGAENESVFNRVKPFLECMGKSIFNCQKIGAGQIAKVCNNMALAIEMIGISESLALGAKLGMDSNILTNIMKVSSSRCWSVDTYNPVPGVMENVPASRDYERGFACELMLKDVKLALGVAEEVHCKTELGKKSAEIYEQLVKSGLGKKDFGVIYDSILKNKL